MKKIEIYITNYCPFCVKAKSLLNKKKIKFSEINVSNDEGLREKMSAMTNGARSVPQIFADGVHIGDCDKIHKLDQEKKLDKLIGLE
jgi:glutaredoxin 3